RPVLKGEQQVALRRAPVLARNRRGPRRASGTPEIALTMADDALLDRLKAWRLAEARAQAVPAFVILHDRTLAEIARQRPQKIAAFAGISGIGAKKLERYGPALVELVASRASS
ncbi:MAG TPA: HRDC domain-containing protein, partial [Casimicrobiaceae bacterium]